MSNEDIPRFESAVAIRPARVPNVQGDFGALGSVFSQISRSSLAIGQNLADQKAKLAGAEAGEEPGLKLEPGVTEATRAFNRSAIASNKTFNLMNIREEAKNIHGKVTSTKNFSIEADPIGQFTKEYGQFSDEVLQGILPENRQAAQNAINFYGGNALRSIQGKVETLTYNTAVNHNQNALKGLKSGMILSGLQGDTAGAGGQYGAAMQEKNNAVQSGVMSPGEGAQTEQSFQKDFHQSQIMGGMQEAISQNKGVPYLRDYEKSKKPKSFQGMDSATFLVKMRGALANREGQDAVDNQTLVDHANRQVDSLQFEDNPNWQHNISVIRSRNPGLADKMEQKAQGLIFYRTVGEQSKYLPLAQRQELFAKSEREIAESTNPNKVQLFRSLQRLQKNQNKNLLEDPAAYVQNSPVYQTALSAYQVATKAHAEAQDPITEPTGDLNVDRLLTPQLNSSKTKALNTNFTQVSLNLQRSMGVPEDQLSVLTNVEAAAIVGNASNLTPDKEMLAVGQLLARPEYQGHSTIILRDLKQAGMKDPTTWGLAMAGNPKTAAYVGDLKTALSWTSKEYTQISENVRANGSDIPKSQVNRLVTTALSPYLTSVIDSSNTGASTYRNNIRQMVTKLAYVLVDNKKSESLPDAIKLAANVYANDHYQFFTVDGKSLRAPLGVDTEQATKGMAQITINATQPDVNLQIGKAFAKQWEGLPRAEVETRYKDWVRAHGTWRSLGDSSGYELIDSNGSPILTESGQNFILTNAELANVSSFINQKIDGTPLAPVAVRLGESVGEQFQQLITGEKRERPPSPAAEAIRGAGAEAKQIFRALPSVFDQIKTAIPKAPAEIFKAGREIDKFLAEEGRKFATGVEKGRNE